MLSLRKQNGTGRNPYVQLWYWCSCPSSKGGGTRPVEMRSFQAKRGNQKMEPSRGNISMQQTVGGSLLGIGAAKSRVKPDGIELP